MLFPEHPMPFFDELIGNDKDYAAARVAYKLDLKGPAFSIQSACSSSLVGVATACQALQDYHCDMALAGAFPFPCRRSSAIWPARTVRSRATPAATPLTTGRRG